LVGDSNCLKVTRGATFFARITSGTAASYRFGPRQGYRRITRDIFGAISTNVPIPKLKLGSQTQMKGQNPMTAETRMPCEPEHDFILLLTGANELTQELEDKLFDAGCDDATLSLRSGRIYLSFTRSAPSLREAILSAIQNVDSANAGVQVFRVDDCNLVTQADIARRIGRSRSLVNQYISGARGPGRFPAPVCGLSDETPLWQWCEVAYWLRQNDMIGEEAMRDARDTAMINIALDCMHQHRLFPEHFDLILRTLSPHLVEVNEPKRAQPV
jgi:hypothetical protein